MIIYCEHKYINERELLEYVWRQLYCKKRHSFFLSWCWINTWLKSLPTRVDISFVIGYKDESAVVIFIKGSKYKKIFSIPFIKYISINASGDKYFDSVMIEYNAFLAADKNIISLPDLLNSKPLANADVVSMPGFIDLPKDISLINKDDHVVESYRHPSFFVELGLVSKSNLGYLGLLSSDRRRQLKRSLHLLSRHGDLVIKKAEDSESANTMFDALLQLHKKSWNCRGKSGAFENPFIKNFHRKLLSQGASDEVCIFQIKAGDLDVGYIYGYMSQGNFLYYQSGFRLFSDNKIKGGISCHALLIDYLSSIGIKRYDFLTGGNQYKEKLSTGKEYLVWLRVYRKNWATSILLNSRKLRSLNIDF